MVIIKSKIVSYSVGSTTEKKIVSEPFKLKARPETLRGFTYKVKGGSMQDAYYITINNDDEGKPAEIFINTKDTKNFQWVTSLMRMMSAVFRRADDVAFMIEELKATADPSGGVGFMKVVGMDKPKFIASIPAAIGYVLEHHVKEPVQAVVQEPVEVIEEGQYPESATVCNECGEKAVILMDGCNACLNCGDSKCG